VLSELEDLARRLEQQILAYEKLHADEMKRFEEQLAAYRNLQNDELQMLRNELTQLKDEIEHLKQEESAGDSGAALTSTEPASAPPATLVVTRRELLTGKIPLPSQRRI
jgi:chromosome segregation ATPase